MNDQQGTTKIIPSLRKDDANTQPMIAGTNKCKVRNSAKKPENLKIDQVPSSEFLVSTLVVHKTSQIPFQIPS